MAHQCQACDIDGDLVKKITDFKFRKEKNIAAIIMKIEDHIVKADREYEDISIEELQEELPEHQPCYVLLSYVFKTSDGRETFPHFFIYINPSGYSPEVNMMYTSTKLAVVNAAKATKVIDLRGREEFTEEVIITKLK